MTLNAKSQDPEVLIADLEGQLQESRFNFKVVFVWASVSALAAAVLAAIVIVGIRSSSREAQYLLLILSLISLILSLFLLKAQKRKLFSIERALRQLRVLRRSSGTPSNPERRFESARERHRAETWEYIERQGDQAVSNRRIHNIFQSVIIVGSILVTALTSAATGNSPFNWVTVVTSGLVTASAGLSSYFKFRERGFGQQQTVNAIEKHLNAFDLRIGDYPDDMQEDEATRKFAERVEELKQEQRDRELQLEQSPERTATQGAAPAAAM